MKSLTKYACYKVLRSTDKDIHTSTLSPVIPGGGEDNDHQLQLWTDLRTNGLQVGVRSIIWNLHNPGILDLRTVVSFPYLCTPILHTSIPMGGATLFIMLTNSAAFALSLLVTTTTHCLRGTCRRDINTSTVELDEGKEKSCGCESTNSHNLLFLHSISAPVCIVPCQNRLLPEENLLHWEVAASLGTRQLHQS